MKRWWIIPAVVGVLAITGLGYWGYGLSREKNQLVTYLNNRNQRAFYEMMGNVENVEATISKSIVSSSPTQRMMLFSDIWQQANAAQQNLSQIPMTEPSVIRTSRFLNQTGDFAWSLAKKYARGTTIKPADVKQLNDLHTQAGYLAVELQNIEKSAASGQLLWDKIKGRTDSKLKNQATPVPMGLQKIDKNMQGFPTLIYDGPFSDHIFNRKPTGLTGANVNAARAGDIARSFVQAGSKGKYKVVKTESVNGTIPAFRIHLMPQNAAIQLVITDVSKKGGHILSMINTRTVSQIKLPSAKAITLASSFLVGRNIKNMAPTYMIEQQKTGIVIFEYKQDGVIIYPDLMKVKVSLDTGEVVGFEGASFLMNHHTRKLPKPKVTEKEALAAINPELKVTSKRLAVIPLENLQEVFVYEFRGDLKGDTFIVYVNAETGKEERILKVIDTNSGPVTM